MKQFLSSAFFGGLLLTSPVFGQTRYTTIDLGLSPTARSTAGAKIGNGQQVGYSFMNSPVHALLWSGSASTVVDLHPSSLPAGSTSAAYGVGGGQQVGFANSRAALWFGSPDSYVDLHPAAGFSDSTALMSNGSQQIGSGTTTAGHPHALLWSGSAAGAIDLHPTGGGWINSYGNAISGNFQVGSIDGGSGQGHAVIWAGSPRIVADLHQSKYVYTEARAMYGNQQVGTGNVMASAGHGFVTTSNHALLWTGTASSLVDLHPAGFTDTFGTGAGVGKQVGFGMTPTSTNCPPSCSVNHALVWSGSTSSMLDLNQFLPAGYTDAQAYGIDPQGNIVGMASNDSAHNLWHAVMWIPLN